ncbi:MAG TPA: response regulator, partial [Candidatus Polarisedimenticolia bacterium]|nr:response regulator [Candidatus Polarisedimenticolia bacterium]
MPSTFPTAAESRSPSILIIDDEPQMRGFLSEALRDHGHFVDTAENGNVAVEKAQVARFDLALCDLRMPGIGGLETLERIKAINPDIEVIIITAHGTLENAIESLRMGASDFLQKPLILKDLLFSVTKAL